MGPSGGPKVAPESTREVEGRPGPLRRALDLLRRHPVLCLALLTPGIPEYLSSSSSLTLFFLNPAVFAIFLGANLAMYVPGALLIREARVRWGIGWAGVMVLGAAYGILEEGLGLNTLFYSGAGPVGGLGYYGHFLGVNWVFVPGVLMVHIVMSISIPLLLFGFAFPEFDRRPLLSRRGVRVAAAVLGTDILALALLTSRIYHFVPGAVIWGASIAVVAALIALAYRVRGLRLLPPTDTPTTTPFRLAVLGALLFPVTLLTEAFSEYAAVPPAITVLLVLGWFVLLFAVVWRRIGRSANRRHLLAFATGAVAPVAAFGVLAALPVPVVLAADLAFAGFVRHLWRALEGAGAPPARPPLVPAPPSPLTNPS